VSTMYRILRANGEVRERRHLARHPEYRKPELLATGPRQVFSWDITKIRGPQKGVWFSLLVMIDIFSRYVVGWMLVRRSNAAVAEHFIAQVLKREKIAPGQAVYPRRSWPGDDCAADLRVARQARRRSLSQPAACQRR